MQYINEYTGMLMHKARQQELMQQAEKHRLATLAVDIARRVRRAQRRFNPPRSNG